MDVGDTFRHSYSMVSQSEALMERVALSIERRLLTQRFLEVQMNLQFGEKVIQVKSGEV
jgi:hypothetical protein